MKRKLLIISLLLLVMIMLTACIPSELGRFIIQDPNDHREEMFVEILSAFENEDIEQLKSVFSKTAQETIPDYDQNLQTLLSFCDFKVEDYKDKTSYAGGSIDNRGYYIYFIEARYLLNTDKGKFLLQFYDQVIDKDTPENVGATSMCIVEYSAFKEWEDKGIFPDFIINDHCLYSPNMEESK